MLNRKFASLASLVKILLLALTAAWLLQGCFLRGDPRKNCNHPKHGEYMKEQQMKKMGF